MATGRCRWVVSLVVAVAVLPGVGRAHEVAGSRFDAPVPLSLMLVGAGVTVAVTALWLGVGNASLSGRSRRLQLGETASAWLSWLRLVVAGLFLVLVAVAMLHGILGRQVAAENVATVFTWPVWFHGLALLAILAGTPWRTLSPWRAIHRGLSRLEGHELALLGRYPAGLGAWPALLGFVVLLGILENVSTVPLSPRLTTAVLAGYAAWMIAGGTLFGRAWLRHGDPLAVLYRLFGRVSPLVVSRTDHGFAVSVRAPWQGCLEPVQHTGLVTFAVAMVYTVSFDGLTDTRLFQDIRFGTADLLGTTTGAGVVVYVLGLLGFVGVFLLIIRLVERLGTGETGAPREAARAVAPTLLPIAAGYEVAHAYPYVLDNVGRLLGLAVQPLAPAAMIDLLWWLSLPAFWGSQVVLIVLGHVVAVVAAHGVALARYGTARRARRAHLPLVALMVGYTMLSLWIVSQPVLAG